MNRLKKNLPEGKSFCQALEDDMFDDAFPTSDKSNINTNDVICHMFESSATGLGYTDLSGKFPYRSSWGNNYILVAYHYHANVILSVTVKK